jgi:hypothetical protein
MTKRRSLNTGRGTSTVLHYASGPDIATPLLMFDPARVICVDQTRFYFRRFMEALEKSSDRLTLVYGAFLPRDRRAMPKEIAENILDIRREECYWDGDVARENLETLTAYELFKLGVDKRSIKPAINAYGNVEIKFVWGYPGEDPKPRAFTFIKANAVLKTRYPRELNDVLRNQVDYFYMKASERVLNVFGKVLPEISGAVKRGAIIGCGDIPVASGALNNIDVRLGESFKRGAGVNGEYERLFKCPSYGWEVFDWLRVGEKVSA